MEKCTCNQIASDAPLQVCPFQQDVHNDNTPTCRCCSYCRQQCADDI